MDLGLKDKPVLVMAASDGIGKGIAKEFAREGARVMLVARSEERLKQAQDEIAAVGAKPLVFVGDISKAEDIEAAVATASKELGGIYALVNNSGGPPPGQFEDFDDANWQSAFELTLFNFVRATRAVLPAMKAAGSGRIVNIASSSTKRVIEGLLLSNTFRMGMVGLTKTIAREFGQYNILVNMLSPGKIATKRVDQIDQAHADAASISFDELQKKSAASIPLGRYGSTEEFGRTAVYLCSEANTYVTGQNIVIDGGAVDAY